MNEGMINVLETIVVKLAKKIFSTFSTIYKAVNTQLHFRHFFCACRYEYFTIYS